MRPLWYATHAVVDRMEADPEFARFVHASEKDYQKRDMSVVEDDEMFEVMYVRSTHPEWTIRIVTNWDRSKTTISFPGEELDDEQ